MKSLDALIREAESLTRQCQALTDELKGYRAANPTMTPVALLKRDGKLTEEGVRVLHEAFALGMSSSAAARHLGISVPATLYRRARWEAEKARSESQ